jgi:regulator of sigma E protease
MDAILGNTAAVVGLVVGFGFLIFVHELGHFLAAKMVGIKVTQFAIGFGPAIFSYRKGLGIRAGSTEAEYETAHGEKNAEETGNPVGAGREASGAEALGLKAVGENGGQPMSETEYRLNWLPLGGYVKMLGQEDMDPTATSEDPRAFNRKPVWARAIVISAGVFMNLVSGLLLFIIAFMAGVTFPPAIVGGTIPGSPAATAYALGHDHDLEYQGLKAGDRVLTFDGEAVTDFTDLVLGTALSSPGQTVTLEVEREPGAPPLTYRMTPVKSRKSSSRFLSIGVEQSMSLHLAGKSEDDAPLPPELSKAGVTWGMKAVEAAGKPVARFDQLMDAIRAGKGEPVPVTFANEAGGQRVTAELRAQAGLGQNDQEQLHLAGLRPMLEVAQVSANTVAAKMGLQDGDVIAAIDGQAWPSYDEGIQAIRNAAGKTITIRVLRQGELVTLDPAMPLGKPGKGKLGFAVAYGGNSAPLVAGVLPDSPAAALQLAPGDRIDAIGDLPVQSWTDVQRLLQRHALAGTEVSVTFTRRIKGNPQVQGRFTLDEAAAAELAGANWHVPAASYFLMLTAPITADDPLAATAMGLHKTKQFMLQTYLTLYRLFQGTVPIDELRGPVGIVDAGIRTARDGGPTYLLFFLGLISVNLVVINFLPLPIVDGGLMVFLIIEKLKGSPVSPKVLMVANWIGLVIIGGVMLMTFYFDITRPPL